MIGKLQSWRGGDNSRSKEWRHSGVGGLVSIEDLAKKPKTPPAAKPAKKVCIILGNNCCGRAC
jgi:hypothetical protein